jgi:Zn-dependent protease
MINFQATPSEIVSDLVVLGVTLVVGLTVHEFAHAWSAFRLGDMTAYAQGRLTLDPRKHIDPVGAIMFFLAGFGWARPVPIDPHRLGRRGTLLVSLAGPASNLGLAACAALLSRFGVLPELVASFLAYFAFLNVLLAFFNMLPIPPLDGWRVLMEVIPPRQAMQVRQYEPYGAMVLIALIVFGSVRGFSVLSAVVRDPAVWVTQLLLGS